MYDVPLHKPSVRGIPSLCRLSLSFSPSEMLVLGASIFDKVVMALKGSDTNENFTLIAFSLILFCIKPN
jgi:hypothetical protein